MDDTILFNELLDEDDKIVFKEQLGELFEQFICMETSLKQLDLEKEDK